MKKKINSLLVDLLQPSNTIPDLLQPSSGSATTNNHNNGGMSVNNTSRSPQPPVGSTWTNPGSLNIDLDDLMGNKKKSGPAPTMNQLKSTSNNTSPVHQVAAAKPPLTPTAAYIPAFVQSQQQQQQSQFNANFDAFQ